MKKSSLCSRTVCIQGFWHDYICLQSSPLYDKLPLGHHKVTHITHPIINSIWSSTFSAAFFCVGISSRLPWLCFMCHSIQATFVQYSHAILTLQDPIIPSVKCILEIWFVNDYLIICTLSSLVCWCNSEKCLRVVGFKRREGWVGPQLLRQKSLLNSFCTLNASYTLACKRW